MLKFAFLLDLKSEVIVNAKPKRIFKSVREALELIKTYSKNSELTSNQRLNPIKVNPTTKVYGQVNDSKILFAVFADVSLGSKR